MSSMLTGCNSKKLLPQSNVNKEHVFFKKKKKFISLCSITQKGQMSYFLDTSNVIRKAGQVDKHASFKSRISDAHNTQRCKQKTAQTSCLKRMFYGGFITRDN